jgi:hypothetical protein
LKIPKTHQSNHFHLGDTETCSILMTFASKALIEIPLYCSKEGEMRCSGEGTYKLLLLF